MYGIRAAVLAFALALPMAMGAQGCVYADEHPLREVRAVWLTTLNGLDWPRTKARDAASAWWQRKELCDILDAYKRANINVVILQTRIRGSVIYPSQYEPWDACLTGKANQSPGYDPIAFCVEECHKRGMELHTWIVFTPLGTMREQASYGAASVTKRRKELVRSASGYWFMNPGNPATADYMAAICREVAERYDIDGISLDYIRYPESTYRFNDYDLYPQGCGMSREAWRRENITRVVRRIHDEVKAIKPWVKLSSSPIGKYRDLARYSSYGWNSYDAVFQDPLAWLRNDLQDLLFPMMYFQGNHFYPFLFNWAENAYGHPVAPGLGIYFLDPREGHWKLNDVRAELHTVRNSGVGGVAFYRSDFLTRNVKGIYDNVREEFFPYPALMPRMTWMGDTVAPAAPPSIAYVDGRIEWGGVASAKEVLYNVYGSSTYPVDVTRPENLLEVNLRTTRYELTGRATRCRYFAVTSTDRFGNESQPTQEQPVAVELPEHINVPRLINPPTRTAAPAKKAAKRKWWMLGKKG